MGKTDHNWRRPTHSALAQTPDARGKTDIAKSQTLFVYLTPCDTSLRNVRQKIPKPSNQIFQDSLVQLRIAFGSHRLQIEEMLSDRSGFVAYLRITGQLLDFINCLRVVLIGELSHQGPDIPIGRQSVRITNTCIKYQRQSTSQILTVFRG